MKKRASGNLNDGSGVKEELLTQSTERTGFAMLPPNYHHHGITHVNMTTLLHSNREKEIKDVVQKSYPSTLNVFPYCKYPSMILSTGSGRPMLSNVNAILACPWI